MHFAHPLADVWYDPALWHSMFGLSLSVAEKIFRAALVYFALMIGVRLSGKRALAQLDPFDLIVLLMLSNTVQNAIIGKDDSLTGGLIGAAALLAINYAVLRMVYLSPRLQNLIGGSPDVLIHQGELCKQTLVKELVTTDELESAARGEGIDSLKDVEKCVLEPTGHTSFIPRKPNVTERQYDELLSRFDNVTAQLTALRLHKPFQLHARHTRQFRGAMARSDKS